MARGGAIATSRASSADVSENSTTSRLQLSQCVQMGLEGGPFVVVQGIGDVAPDVDVHLVQFVHASTPNASRRPIRPSRIRVFAVPSGSFNNLATCACV